MQAAEVLAPAKVNLTLEVTGRRPDGYHLLDSLVVFADLGDTLRWRARPETTLAVTGPEAGALGAEPDNLVLRAAALAGLGGAFELEKRLPVASGIGGGSADAAAVLRLAAALGHPLPPLADQAALGADVPMCVGSRPVRVGGIGERLTPLALGFELPAVLVNPRVPVSTPEVFAGLDRPVASDAPEEPGALPRWTSPAEMAAWLEARRNDLEPPARRLVPEISAVLAGLGARPGCLLARMSGSGATCFGLFESRAAAAAAAAALAQEKPGWWVVPTVLGDREAMARPRG